MDKNLWFLNTIWWPQHYSPRIWKISLSTLFFSFPSLPTSTTPFGKTNIPQSGKFPNPPPLGRHTASQTGMISNRSINCWSTARLLGAENRRYSSNIEVRDHACNRRMQPIKQPVRCLPLLQWMSMGWFRRSRMATRAAQITSSGMLSKGSCAKLSSMTWETCKSKRTLFPGIPNCYTLISNETQ